MNRLYTVVSRPVVERLVGSFHAGTVVKSLYLQWTLGPLLEQAGRITLDAGCGSGAPLTRLLAKRFSMSRFMGLDLKLGDSQSRPSNLWLCLGDLRLLPASGPFDVIYCIDVLEHLENVEACISDLARCLAPGGYIFLHVPSRHQRHFIPGVDLEYSWLGPGQPGDAHIWAGFEPQELATWLRNANCEILLNRFTFGEMTTILKELFMLGEEYRIPGVGLALLPFVVIAAWLERHIGSSKGNGILILARSLGKSGEPKDAV